MAFDYAKFKELNELLKKAQFVPMDPGMAAPPAGGPPPEGGDPGAAPPPGGDPGAAPPPMDPSMMGGMPPPPPMDPSMMGGMPPPPADPGAGGSMVSMPTDEFLKFLKQIIGLIDKHNDAVGPQQQSAPNPALPAGSSDPQLSEINAKLDALLR